MERFEANNEIASIIIKDDKIIYGTYHLENNVRSGAIYIYNEFLTDTSGTFQITKYNKSLITANSQDIMKIDNIIHKIETPHMNTCLIIDNLLYSTQSNGNISIYNYNLEKQEEYIICKNHILWCAEKVDNYLLCGCDCGNFIIYDIRTKNRQAIKRESGIISIYKWNGKIYVGSYDGFLFVYDLGFNIISKNKFGNVWKMINAGNYLATACMYDGVKIVNDNFDIIKKYDVKSIAYGLDIERDIMVFSDFYEKCYYKVHIDF